ncbi:MAG: hypothetical protein RSG55_06500 [Oscillospiraceae bacterium]
MGLSGIANLSSMFGTSYQRAHTAELKMKFEKKRLDPRVQEEEKSPRERELERMQEDARKIRESNVTSSLDIKLCAGGTLTDDELEYLKTKSPELYQKAIEIKKERAQYKKELERCRTKEDVEELNSRKMQQFVSEIKAVKNNPNIASGKKREIMEQINRRAMGILSEHSHFVSSRDYEELPTEEEIEEGEKKEKAKKTSPDAKAEDSDFYKNQLKEELADFGISDEAPQKTENTVADKAPREPDAPKSEVSDTKPTVDAGVTYSPDSVSKSISEAMPELKATIDKMV